MFRSIIKVGLNLPRFSNKSIRLYSTSNTRQIIHKPSKYSINCWSKIECYLLPFLKWTPLMSLEWFMCLAANQIKLIGRMKNEMYYHPDGMETFKLQTMTKTKHNKIVRYELVIILKSIHCTIDLNIISMFHPVYLII